MTAKQRKSVARVLALLVVILLSLYIYSIRDQVKELAQYGYLGIFLLSILANATLLLPAQESFSYLRWEQYTIRLELLWQRD